jgi:hypothetical protein
MKKKKKKKKRVKGKGRLTCKGEESIFQYSFFTLFLLPDISTLNSVYIVQKLQQQS